MQSDSLGIHVERFLGIKHNPETRTWYAKYLAPMVDFLGADCPLTAATRVDAEAYWLAVQARKTCWESHPMKPTQHRPLSPTTLHNHLRATRTFWNALVRQRVVGFNPFDHLTSPKDTRPVVMKAIASEDLRAIRQGALDSSKRDFAIVTVMETSGARDGVGQHELRQLDLKQGIAWVKGKRGWRKVFLDKASVQAIQAYLLERPTSKGDALWLNIVGQPLTTDGVLQLVDRLADKAGITGRHNLHAFRHRAAQALGHADVTVTLQIYGNQDDRRVAQAIRQAEMAPFEEPPGLTELEVNEITAFLGRPTR